MEHHGTGHPALDIVGDQERAEADQGAGGMEAAGMPSPQSLSGPIAAMPMGSR